MCLGHERERRPGRSIPTILQQVLDVSLRDMIVILLAMGRKWSIRLPSLTAQLHQPLLCNPG